MISIFELPVQYTVVFIAMAFIFGAVIGSFLNVVILRTPLKQSIITSRSHCWTCGKQLKNIDLIPIFSYIFLRGRCRFCKAKISPRYWIVELTTALMYVLCICVLGLSAEMLFAIVLIPVLIVLSGIDIDHMQIPYLCSLIIAVLGIISIFVFPQVPWTDHLIGGYRELLKRGYPAHSAQAVDNHLAQPLLDVRKAAEKYRPYSYFQLHIFTRQMPLL